jgi:imidazolonepropionase
MREAPPISSSSAEPKSAILIRSARQLLTLHGPTGPRRGPDLDNLGLIEDGAVLIINGMIDSVGPTRRIENLAEAHGAVEISAAGRVVMPGFVDSCASLLSTSQNIPRTAGSVGTITTVEFYTRRLLEICLRHGTTMIESNSIGSDHPQVELRSLRLLDALDQRLLRVIPVSECSAQVAKMVLPKAAARGFTEFGRVQLGHGIAGSAEAHAHYRTTRECGLLPKIASNGDDSASVKFAVETDAVSVDGIRQATDDDVQRLARSATVAVMKPAELFHEGTKVSGVGRTLTDGGAPVALGSGFHVSRCPNLSMQFAISTACRYLGLTPAEAISAATINSAHALRAAARYGSLEFGKCGDVLMLNTRDYRDLASYAGVNLVSMVMRQGRILYQEPNVPWSR